MLLVCSAIIESSWIFFLYRLFLLRRFSVCWCLFLNLDLRFLVYIFIVLIFFFFIFFFYFRLVFWNLIFLQSMILLYLLLIFYTSLLSFLLCLCRISLITVFTRTICVNISVIYDWSISICCLHYLILFWRLTHIYYYILLYMISRFSGLLWDYSFINFLYKELLFTQMRLLETFKKLL